MRIVIDLQSAQSGSRLRGIGRYSLALAVAMARHASGHELHVVLNGRFPETIASIRAAFCDSLADDRFHVWMPIRSGPFAQNDGVDERIREAFLASLKPDFVHVSSLFEGLDDPVVTSVGTYPATWKTAVTLFDLIPLIHQQTYLQNAALSEWYFGKLAHLRRADLLLGISASATQEAIDHLGFMPDEVRNISSAIDAHFVQKEITAAEEEDLRGRFSLALPFVMYTGGIDHRKNIDGLIKAYASLPDSLRKAHQLAIVCSVSPQTKQSLMQSAERHGLREGELVLTGYVAEEDLVGLYNLCRLFVFPSWHEGFGLPALEAMQCGAPVIASNTSSLPEVIGLDEAMFDPHDVGAIASKILQGLTDPDFRDRLVNHAPVQAKKFSWDTSAQLALAAMAECHAKVPTPAGALQQGPRRPRMAYVSPLPPEQSGIADFSAELVPELARHYEIDVIVDQTQVADMQVKGAARIRDVVWFYENASRYDRVLYHFGNSKFHVHMCEMLERVPGVVVLHDFFLSGMTAYRDLTLGEAGVWPNSLYRSHGYAPLPSVASGHHGQVIHDYPCNFPVISAAIGLIAHSEYFFRLAATWYPNEATAGRSTCVPLARATATLSQRNRESAREALGFADDAFVISSFGFMAPTKQNHRLLDAWLSSPLASDPRVHLIFVGGADPNAYGAEISKKMRDSEAASRVRITGYTSARQFKQYLLASDMAVQLRTMSRGETSASILDALNYGLPTIINANGAAEEISDEAVIKLADEFTDSELRDAMVQIHADKGLRDSLATKARQLIVDKHSPRRCAEAYVAAIEKFYRQEMSEVGLLGSIADHLGSDGQMPDEMALGRALEWALPARLSAHQVLFDIDTCASEVKKRGDAVTRALILNPPQGWRVEPIRWSHTDGCYFYATDYVLRMLGCPVDMLRPEPLQIGQGDLVLSLPGAASERQAELCLRGVKSMDFNTWFDAQASGTRKT